MDKTLIDFVSSFNSNITLNSLKTIIEKNLNESNITLHPYGFYILKINDFNSEDYNLRIHVWLKGKRNKQSPDWRPHQHNLDIYSYILKGSVTNIIWNWEECKNLSDAHERIYIVEYENNISKLKKTDDIGNLIFNHKTTYVKNTHYLVKKDEFHFTDVPEDNESITLAFFSKKTNGTPKVVGSINGEKEYLFNREKIDKEILIETKKFIKKHFSI